MSRERRHDADGAPAGARPGEGAARPNPEERPPTARRILAAARDILAERGYEALTMTAISQQSGVNRALVSYYFGGKAGLLTALVDTLFQDPGVGLVEEIRAAPRGAERVERFLDWQRRVSQNDRTNRMLYELLPHALRDPEVRARFAEEYRLYREVDADCLGTATRELTAEQADALAAVSIAVVEGLGMQRALDPEGFDHLRAWRAWREVVGSYLTLPAE
jgi:AcrR family transcriptional regulator